MALDRKTPLNVSFYDHDEQKIQTWAFNGSTRLALLVNTITHIKNKIDTNKYNNEKEIEEAIDYVKYEVKKFIETQYTTEENA
jgi:hypothetical protein